MLVSTDIDIDIADRDRALIGLPCISAIESTSDGVKRHGSGYYFQDIPVDPTTGMAVFDYKKAEDLGYFKVDLLSSNVYNDIESEAHLDRLLSQEPDWKILEERSLYDGLFHVENKFGVVQSIRPKSIEDLAVVLALIRPAYAHLVGQPRSIIDAEVWKPSKDDKYSFKRAHAIAYASIIVVQLNLMTEKMLKEMIEEQENADD